MLAATAPAMAQETKSGGLKLNTVKAEKDETEKEKPAGEKARGGQAREKMVLKKYDNSETSKPADNKKTNKTTTANRH